MARRCAGRCAQPIARDSAYRAPSHTNKGRGRTILIHPTRKRSPALLSRPAGLSPVSSHPARRHPSGQCAERPRVAAPSVGRRAPGAPAARASSRSLRYTNTPAHPGAAVVLQWKAVHVERAVRDRETLAPRTAADWQDVGLLRPDGAASNCDCHSGNTPEAGHRTGVSLRNLYLCGSWIVVFFPRPAWRVRDVSEFHKLCLSLAHGDHDSAASAAALAGQQDARV